MKTSATTVPNAIFQRMSLINMYLSEVPKIHNPSRKLHKRFWKIQLGISAMVTLLALLELSASERRIYSSQLT
jgi:hypothetical protein